jgi:multidrug efflux pump subunit AcrA (membrane-fusion protein)
MGVRVAFLTTAPTGGGPAPAPALLVPADAVRGEGSTTTVFVHTGERVERRPVSAGQTVGGDREILGGLRPGERVVVAPPPGLKDGAAVRIAEGSR